MLSESTDNARSTAAPAQVLGFLRLVLIVVWTICWIVLASVAVILTLRRRTALQLAHRVWGPGLLKLSGVRLEVAPLPSIDWTKPHIFVMNHQSMMDIPAAFTTLPVDLHFVAKHSLKYIPFLGWYMWLTGMVFVDRANRQQAVNTISRAARRIRDGANIIVYPEGTRSKDGRLQPFKRGAFVIALQAQVPIVPVAIFGSREVLPSGSFSLQPGVLRVKVGEPVSTTGRTVEERGPVSLDIERRVRQLLDELESGR